MMNNDRNPVSLCHLLTSIMLVMEFSGRLDSRWLANSHGLWSLAGILCRELDRQRLFGLLLDSIDDVLQG